MTCITDLLNRKTQSMMVLSHHRLALGPVKSNLSPVLVTKITVTNIDSMCHMLNDQVIMRHVATDVDADMDDDMAVVGDVDDDVDADVDANIDDDIAVHADIDANVDADMAADAYVPWMLTSSCHLIY